MNTPVCLAGTGPTTPRGQPAPSKPSSEPASPFAEVLSTADLPQDVPDPVAPKPADAEDTGEVVTPPERPNAAESTPAVVAAMLHAAARVPPTGSPPGPRSTVAPSTATGVSLSPDEKDRSATTDTAKEPSPTGLATGPQPQETLTDGTVAKKPDGPMRGSKAPAHHPWTPDRATETPASALASNAVNAYPPQAKDPSGTLTAVPNDGAPLAKVAGGAFTTSGSPDKNGTTGGPVPLANPALGAKGEPGMAFVGQPHPAQTDETPRVGPVSLQPAADMAGLALPTTVHRSAETHMGHVSTPVTHPGFPTELAAEVQWMITKTGIQKAELQLNPVELGPIRIELSLQAQVTDIRFSAVSAQTRDGIAQSLPQLAELLREQGLSLGQTHVGTDSSWSGQGREPPAGPAETPRATGSTQGSVPLSAWSTPVRVDRRLPRGVLDLYA